MIEEKKIRDLIDRYQKMLEGIPDYPQEKRDIRIIVQKMIGDLQKTLE